MINGCTSRCKLDPGFLKDDGKLVTITFQERCRKTIWTRFLTVGTVQNDIRSFMALDKDTTLAEFGIPLVKQILAMQRRRCKGEDVTRPCRSCAASWINFSMHAVSSTKLPLWASHNSVTARGIPCLSRLRDCSVDSCCRCPLNPSAGSDRISGLARVSTSACTGQRSAKRSSTCGGTEMLSKAFKSTCNSTMADKSKSAAHKRERRRSSMGWRSNNRIYPWRRAIHPMPHSCARMDATLTTHYSTFQNRSEQSSDPQRRPRCLRWKHSLLPIQVACWSWWIRVASASASKRKKKAKCLDPSHSHTKATSTPSTAVTRAGLKRSAQASCTRTPMPWMKKRRVLQHYDKKKAQLWRQ